MKRGMQICKPGRHAFNNNVNKPCDCGLWESYVSMRKITERPNIRNMASGRKGYTVNQFRPDGTLVATYKSLREAERASGIGHSSMCLKVKKNYNKETTYLWRLA